MPQILSEFAHVPRSETRERFTRETNMNTRDFAHAKFNKRIVDLGTDSTKRPNVPRVCSYSTFGQVIILPL